MSGLRDAEASADRRADTAFLVGVRYGRSAALTEAADAIAYVRAHGLDKAAADSVIPDGTQSAPYSEGFERWLRARAALTATPSPPAPPTGELAGVVAAPSELTPWEHFERLRRHHAHWADEITDCRTTRTLDGLFVAAEWTSPPRHGAETRQKPIWHHSPQQRPHRGGEGA